MIRYKHRIVRFRLYEIRYRYTLVWYVKLYRHSQDDCDSLTVAPSNFICLCVYLTYCLFVRFYGSHLFYCRSDFDETWWKCWRLGLINCTKFSYKSINWWRHYDVIFSFCIFAKGHNSFVQGKATATKENGTVKTIIQATTILSCKYKDSLVVLTSNLSKILYKCMPLWLSVFNCVVHVSLGT